MATSLKPADGTNVTIAVAGTVVSANPQPFDNTHTVIVYNTTDSVTGYLNWQASGAAMAATTAVVVPGGGSITLSIGSKSNRVASADTLRFDASAAAVFQITYVNGRTA